MCETTHDCAMLELVVSNLRRCECEVDVGLFDSDYKQTVSKFSVTCPDPIRVSRDTALNTAERTSLD